MSLHKCSRCRIWHHVEGRKWNGASHMAVRIFSKWHLPSDDNLVTIFFPTQNEILLKWRYWQNSISHEKHYMLTNFAYLLSLVFSRACSFPILALSYHFQMAKVGKWRQHLWLFTCHYDYVKRHFTFRTLGNQSWFWKPWFYWLVERSSCDDSQQDVVR